MRSNQPQLVIDDVSLRVPVGFLIESIPRPNFPMAAGASWWAQRTREILAVPAAIPGRQNRCGEAGRFVRAPGPATIAPSPRRRGGLPDSPDLPSRVSPSTLERRPRCWRRPRPRPIRTANRGNPIARIRRHRGPRGAGAGPPGILAARLFPCLTQRPSAECLRRAGAWAAPPPSCCRRAGLLLPALLELAHQLSSTEGTLLREDHNRALSPRTVIYISHDRDLLAVGVRLSPGISIRPPSHLLITILPLVHPLTLHNTTLIDYKIDMIKVIFFALAMSDLVYRRVEDFAGVG